MQKCGSRTIVVAFLSNFAVRSWGAKKRGPGVALEGYFGDIKQVKKGLEEVWRRLEKETNLEAEVERNP